MVGCSLLAVLWLTFFFFTAKTCICLGIYRLLCVCVYVCMYNALQIHSQSTLQILS